MSRPRQIRAKRSAVCCADGRKRLAVSVSGTGSNFRKIHESCVAGSINGNVALVMTSNPTCPAADFAMQNETDVITYPPKELTVFEGTDGSA